MKINKRIFQLTIKSLFVFLILNPLYVFSSSVECTKIIRQFLELKTLDEVATKKILRYPKGLRHSEDAKNHLMFGFESEYTLRDIEKMVDVYAPDREFGMSPQQWLELTPEARVNWVKEHIDELFPEFRQPGKFVKIDQRDELAFLPERLIRDDTGNIEIVLKPVDTLEEFTHQIKLVHEHVGTGGSMQGSVSLPNQAFFMSTEQTNLGYLNFLSEMDTLQKLEVGAARYKQDPSKAAANSFKHPFLSPMNKIRHEQLKEYMEANARGHKLDPDSLAYVSGDESSFKYFGGTAYRPDIAKNRVILEVRDCHTNFDCIMDRVLRATFYFQEGRDRFQVAHKLKPFDTVNDFAKLDSGTQEMLKELFPAPLKAGVSYSDQEKLALEVYRNFSWPMREWSDIVELVNDANLSRTISAAQQKYTSTLKSIQQELANGQLTPDQASIKIQGALSLFADETQILKHLRDFEAKHMFSTAEMNKYAHRVARELEPLRNAFPQDPWEGELILRADRFIQKWSANAKWVDDVDFEGAKRKILVLSESSLSSTEKAKFLEDYTNMISRGTISFPLGERAGHLYTRFGQTTFDFLSGLGASNYRLPQNSKRLEPIVALSPSEELRLRFYLEQAQKNHSKVLGGFSYNGSSESVGTLRNNVATPGHNCTSWICLAPIGLNNKPLLELVGAQKQHEVHTNPGWWNWYLSTAPNPERVPFLVYWDTSPIEASLVKTGQNFPAWDFYKH